MGTTYIQSQTIYTDNIDNTKTNNISPYTNTNKQNHYSDLYQTDYIYSSEIDLETQKPKKVTMWKKSHRLPVGTGYCNQQYFAGLVDEGVGRFVELGDDLYFEFFDNVCC